MNPYTPPSSHDAHRTGRWNLLATRNGRLTAFFLLYVTEGIPLGFTATAVATQMRREGLGPAAIGAFVGMLYLPWAWKWLVAPVVDVVHSDRLGRRRAWIVVMQTLMIVGLLVSMGVDYTANFQLYATIILVVNIFGATQDIAIDALACETLEESERGLANGLMFAGAYVGNALGGAGVLFLSALIGFSSAALLAVGALLAVTLFVALPLQERSREKKVKARRSSSMDQRMGLIRDEIRTYVVQAVGAFIGFRGAWLAVILALLPFGALSLSLALGSILAVELGLTDTQIATLALASTITSAVGCVIGGMLSDRFGRRLMLLIYVIGMSFPPLIMAGYMWREGYIMPIDPTLTDRAVAPRVLVTVFWIVSIAYALFQGLMYGTRTALFMDVCDKTVAATQFTAYMSLLNLTIWYSATWQGWTIEQLGYPWTLTLDVGLGLLCVAILPLVTPRPNHAKPDQLPAEPPPPPNV